MESRNIALASLGAIVLGVAVFFLSSDIEHDEKENEDEELSADFTETKLQELLEITHLELTSIYVSNFNLILQQKENAEFSAVSLQESETKVRSQISKRMEDICSEYCVYCYPALHNPEVTNHDQASLTVESFRKWVARFEETDYVRKQRIAIT